MSRVPLPLLVLAVCALSLSSALALSQVGTEYMDVSEIRPGMQGYGLTVFRGHTPERFGVTVIDVLHNFRPNQDLVLIRTEHPILERAVTVAGMSGSPIYVNDRLIGAYAYGWTFGKEPVAGVTPIASMLAELARPIDPHIWKAIGTLPTLLSAGPREGQSASHGGRRRTARRHGEPASAFSALHHLRPYAEPEAAPSTRYGVPLPAATPVQVSGLGPASIALLERELGPYGLLPVQGSASPALRQASAADERFVDGGSIGVQLVRGDISMMAVGTVTHVTGRRLVGFGHPMLNAGQVALATCKARVVHVLSSMMRSFKLAEPATALGTLVQDRQAAIVVDQALRAELVPLRVKVYGVPGAPRDEWNMEIATHRMLTPGLTLATLVHALEATAIDRTDSVVRVDTRLSIAGHGTHKTHDVVFTAAGAADSGALGRLRAFAALSTVYNNPFEDARVTGVQVDVHVQHERDLLTLVDAQLPGDSVDPDSDTEVVVTLRRFGAAGDRSSTRVIPLHIPRSAAGETLEISVQPGDEVSLEHPEPNSLDDQLAALEDSYPGTSLVVSTKLPSHGVKLRGQLVRSLPDSMLDTFQPATESDRGSLFSSYEHTELPLGHAVTGAARLKLHVRDEPLR